MKKENFDNQLRRQCFSIEKLCREQIAGVQKGMQQIPQGFLKGIQRVIMTGCGDSYLAGIAAIPCFKKYAYTFASKFEACRCIEAARYIQFEPNEAARTLVIGISASGTPARVVEALKKAKAAGCRTLTVTNFADSPCAQASDQALIVHTPAFPEPGPGLRNYFASILGLESIALMLGKEKGLVTETDEQEFFQAVQSMSDRYAERLNALDRQIFEIAEAWQAQEGVETIGDGTMYASAYFIGAKYVEVAGLMAATTDSENWCHVNYFKHAPEKIGLIVVANGYEENRTRIRETLKQAAGIGRPILLLTDESGAAYYRETCDALSVSVCELPDAEKGFACLAPLFNYLPGAVLASYIAALHNEPYFRSEDSPQRRSQVGCTIRDSRICV